MDLTWPVRTDRTSELKGDNPANRVDQIHPHGSKLSKVKQDRPMDPGDLVHPQGTEPIEVKSGQIRAYHVQLDHPDLSIATLS